MNVRDTDDYIKNMLGISKIDLPGLEREVVPAEPITFETPKVELFDIRKTETEPMEPQVELPKVEIPSVPETAPIDMPKIEEPKLPPIELPKDDNPNVYTQSNNTDFINISSLNSEEPVPSPVKSALSGLNVVTTDSEVFGGSDISVEEKDVQNMPSVEIPEVTKQDNDITKVKLATAIRLAKDSAEEIKKAGYNVVIEEVDGAKDYQIIIKVEK